MIAEILQVCADYAPVDRSLSIMRLRCAQQYAPELMREVVGVPRRE
jgi:hypothetical protein